MTGPSTEWKRFYEDGIYYAENLGGVEWADAPIPRRWHRCRAQSRAYFNTGYIERCACGAYRQNLTFWLDRNSRLRLRKRHRFAR